MPKSKITLIDDFQVTPLSVICPLCEAEPVQDCQTKSGRYSAVHAARVQMAASLEALSRSRTRRSRFRKPRIPTRSPGASFKPLFLP
jgi:hypothetical protein